MKCILCNQRKGKRHCPAKNTLICPQCCGEKRVVEIACPADCTYLSSGVAYHWVKKHVSILEHESDPIRRRRLFETTQQYGEFLGELEKVIVRYAQDLHSLSDQNVLEAIELLEKTYQTEEKGVIYEHSSGNPLVQALARELREFMEEWRGELREEGTPVDTASVLKCLEVMVSDIRYHLGETTDSGYLQFITRSHPRTASESGDGKLILGS